MKSPRKLRLFIIGGLVIATGALAVFGFGSIRDAIKSSRNRQAFREAKALLEDDRPAKAFEIIKLRDRSLQKRENEWIDLEIRTLDALGDVGRMRAIFERNPAALMRNEKASVTMARSMLAAGELKAYGALRKSWEPRKTDPASWFMLDADALIKQDDREGAEKLLQSRSFEGSSEATRLNRLALLAAPKSRKQAWSYLEKAYRADPKNPDVRSFRGQILESTGNRQLARVEYVAAHLALPGNPLYRDQLAEFYRRQGRLALAVQTWSGELDDRSADFIRLKALFWSRMATPAEIKSVKASELFGDYAPFVDYLQELPADRFWDEEAFQAKVANRQAIIERRQEAYWLRIAQHLKNGEEQKAYDLILSRPFRRVSWNRDVERALERVLAYRLEEPQPIDMNSFFAMGRGGRNRHQLFGELERMANTGEIPPEMQKLLKSREAFAAIFMAGGWMEAALQLTSSEALPSDIPDWVAYGMTQSVRFNRGVGPALAFAKKQHRTPLMQLLKGELMLADGKSAAGIETLKGLAAKESDIGYRASWLIALAHLDRKEPSKARAALESRQKLRDSLKGRELQARISLAEGNTDEAGEIYRSIASRSTEAKTYLAEVAYREKDWETARRMTLALIDDHPDRMALRENLKAIEQAEAGEKKP